MFHLFVVHSRALRRPLNRNLTIQASCGATLIGDILSVSRFRRCKDKEDVNWRVGVTYTSDSNGPAIKLILIVFQFRDFLRNLDRALTIKLTFEIMGRRVNLVTLATAIRVGGGNATVFVILTILLMGLVSFNTALPRAYRLIRKCKDSRTHLAFTIKGMLIVASSIFDVLSGSASFHPLLRRIANGTRDRVVHVLVFVRFCFTSSTSDSKIKTSVPTRCVGADTLRAIKYRFCANGHFPRREFVSYLLPVTGQL